MNTPAQRALALLEELMEETISMERTLLDAEVDSLTMLEWMFAIEQELEIVLGEEIVETIDIKATIGETIAALVG
jgi:acyl carrier protein